MKHLQISNILVGLSITFFVASCQVKNKEQGDWNYLIEEDGKYTGFCLPKSNLDREGIEVFVATNKMEQPVIGMVQENDSSLVFTPIIPFTPGISYIINHNGSTIRIVTIPNDLAFEVPILEHIYPSGDLLPENLLKFYLKFDRPMSYQPSFQYITLLEDGDTVSSFLELQNELWNADRTMLTLWLDPGRIKRDLVPNRELGNPLKKGSIYQLLISQDWKDANGIALGKTYTKDFEVGSRDESSPDPSKWIIRYDAGEGVVSIQFNESMDYSLLSECFEIINESDEPIEGDFEILDNESVLVFTSITSFPRGSYRTKVNTIMEDLAGNNLNRAFDRDIQKEEAGNEAFVYLLFEVN